MRLFEPGKIGNLTIKNRIVMAPMWPRGLGSSVAPFGYGRRGIDYYVARARGGAGLILTGTMVPSERFEKSIGYPLVADFNTTLWMSELADAVHDYGAKIFVQYTAGFGRQSLPLFGELVAPSPIPGFFSPDITCRELTVEEIEAFVQDFASGAGMIAASGIDGIEIHAHQGYLLDQFMTARTNKRTDKYGGDLGGRLRLPLDLLNAVKTAAGPDYPVTFRYGLTHKLEGQMEGTRTIEEGLDIARRMEAAGVVALHVDAGVYETNNWAQPPTTQPDGCLVELAEMAKGAVDIPVITVGKLGNPALAESVLSEGKADFVALGRPLLADPEWPNKVKEGRPEDIRPCLSCNDGCLGRMFAGKPMSCVVNPQCGNERSLTLLPTEKKKSVVVVGGGPAGMEAARVSALRGHRVVLIEKDAELGGNLITAGAPDFKVAYLQLRDHLVTQLRKQGVVTRLGTEATQDLILSLQPDVVFVATGARPVIPNLPGMDKDTVLTAADLLLRKPDIGTSVVIVGGNQIGTETALYLGRLGKRVTLVERLASINRDMFWINSLDIQRRFDGLESDRLNVKVLTQTEAVEVTRDGLVVKGQTGKEDIVEAETIVLAVGMVPTTGGWVEAIEGAVSEVYRIGDCMRVGKVIDAIWPAFRTARLI